MHTLSRYNLQPGPTAKCQPLACFEDLLTRVNQLFPSSPQHPEFTTADSLPQLILKVHKVKQ